MTHTKGSGWRTDSHYAAHPCKREVLRMWADHVPIARIAATVGIPYGQAADMIRHALIDGEIEERRIIHAEDFR